MRFTGEDINGFYLVDTSGAALVGDVNATPAVSDTAYHDYRLVRTGTTVTAYIDGAEYMAVTDDALGAEGGIGMGSYNDIALFDDFTEGSSEPGAVGKLHQPAFTIFPNPAGDHIQIISEGIIKNLSVTNSLGQEMLELHDIRSMSLNIDISGFKTGLYFITIEDSSSIPATMKLIKK